MNSVQLEQLISGYLDDELSPNRKLEVENLLKSDPTAKKLYDEFVNIRYEIRHIRRQNLPLDFQQKLFERIDSETVSISGKHIEQTTSVDFTLPVAAKQMPSLPKEPRQSRLPIFRAKILRPLRNPRLWACSAVVLLVCFSFFIFDFFGPNPETAFVPPIVPPDVQPVEPGTEIEVPPPSLPGGGSISGDVASHALALKDGKPVVEVTCELSPTARDGQYIPTLLADSGYSYTIRENGNRAVTVYEFELPFDQIFPFISQMMRSRDEIENYQLPDAIITLMHRPAGMGDDQVADTIIMRLNVSKND